MSGPSVNIDFKEQNWFRLNKDSVGKPTGSSIHKLTDENSPWYDPRYVLKFLYLLSEIKIHRNYKDSLSHVLVQ